MDYAELAKRLRHLAKVQRTAFPDTSARTFDDAADAIEALTSPPDEAQGKVAIDAYLATTDYPVSFPGLEAALNAAHRVRVKNEAKA